MAERGGPMAVLSTSGSDVESIMAQGIYDRLRLVDFAIQELFLVETLQATEAAIQMVRDLLAALEDYQSKKQQRAGGVPMDELEVKPVTPKELIATIKAILEDQANPVTKYKNQVGLKNVTFAFDKERAQRLAMSPELTNIERAELYLRKRILVPFEMVEYDGTTHKVVAWDPTPVGYSGFAGCVTHSLILTDKGLFEVGRYAAVNISDFSKVWQWFIHRRVGSTNQEVADESTSDVEPEL